MKLTEIKPSENNPRQITKDKLEKLKKSISEFGKMMELRPIVVDTDGNILGGNMRYRAIKALGISEIPNNWVKVAEGLTEEEKRRFVIEDNVGFGEWDWDVLANEWNEDDLREWGMDLPVEWTSEAGFGTDFNLPDGERKPFQQMTFSLADEQVTLLKSAIEDAKHTEEYKYIETFGNENSNGNALYFIISQWIESRR